MADQSIEHRDLPTGAIAPFLLLTFGIAWGVMGLFLAAPGWVVAIFGEVSGRHPLFVLAVYAPAIAAFSLVLRNGGWRGVKRFLARLTLWRCGANWWAFLILGVPLIYVTGSLLKGNLGSWGDTWPNSAEMARLIALTLILGPIEEFGWRGVLQPLLQRRLAPLWAGLVVGAIWGIWHLPAFLLSGTPQGEWQFLPFLVGSVAVSVIMSALFNDTGGSLLFAGLFHFQLNNPVWPDAQPHDSIVFVLAAAIVLVVRRSVMMDKRSGVTMVMADQRREGSRS